MAEDNSTMTISGLYNAINYDEEAKKVLQAYINSGFGNNIASEHFVHNKGSIVDTEKGTEGVGEKNGNEQSRAISENDELRSEAQVENSGETVQDRSVDGQNTKSSGVVDKSGHRDVSRRVEQVETGKLDDVFERENFIKLTDTIGNNRASEE